MLNIKDPKKHHIRYNDLVRIKIEKLTETFFYFGKVIDVNLLHDKPTYAIELIIDHKPNVMKITVLDINIINNFGEIEYDELSEKFPEWAI
jgi:hypothetical protein